MSRSAEIMKGMGLKNMRHAISIHDVVSDTMHQFAPTYHDYVLYSNGGSKEAPKRARLPSSLQTPLLLALQFIPCYIISNCIALSPTPSSSTVSARRRLNKRGCCYHHNKSLFLIC